GSEFAGVCDFSQSTFHAWGLFNQSRFKSKATFEGVCFRGSAQFEGVDFATDADFRRVRFIPFADFQRAQFKGTVLFNAASIECKVLLRLTRFQNISFEKITLMGTSLRGISFENPRWPGRGLFKSTRRAVVYDEIQKEKPDPEKLAQLYRDIRVNLKQAGTNADLGNLFYSEMEVRRKLRRRPPDSRYFLRRYFSPYTLFWLTCGYGRRPWRAVLTAGAAALLYWLRIGW